LSDYSIIQGLTNQNFISDDVNTMSIWRCRPHSVNETISVYTTLYTSAIGSLMMVVLHSWNMYLFQIIIRYCVVFRLIVSLIHRMSSLDSLTLQGRTNTLSWKVGNKSTNAMQSLRRLKIKSTFWQVKYFKFFSNLSSTWHVHVWWSFEFTESLNVYEWIITEWLPAEFMQMESVIFPLNLKQVFYSQFFLNEKLSMAWQQPSLVTVQQLMSSALHW
jgi:hypothetical protein